MMRCLPSRPLQSAGDIGPGRKEAWGEVDLVGRTVAHVSMCRLSSKCFSVVVIWIWISVIITVVFILLTRNLRHRNEVICPR